MCSMVVLEDAKLLLTNVFYTYNAQYSFNIVLVSRIPIYLAYGNCAVPTV